jgi:hypothetical protein
MMRISNLTKQITAQNARISRLDRAVLQAAQNGGEVIAYETVPAEPTASNTVRASTIRDALIGKSGPMHYRGLRLKGFYIEGNLDLAFTNWAGELSLVNCRLPGDLSLDHAKITGQITLDGSHLRWISAQNAFIDGSFLMRDGFMSDEGFYGIGIRVSGSLNLRNSRIVGPQSISRRMAVELFRANLGDLFLSEAEFNGGIYASGMSVARNIRIQGSVFRSRQALGWEATGPDFKGALTLAGTEVKGSIYLSTTTTRGKFAATGAVSLRSTSCKQLFIHEEILQHDLDLEGLTYNRLRGATPVEILDGLGSHSTPCPQAYIQLASYCQSIGDISTRRRTLVALEKSLTRALPILSITRTLRGLHGVFVGYGYRTMRTIPWLAFSIVLAGLLIHSNSEFLTRKIGQGQQVSTRSTALPWPDSFAYTLDSFLPFASLGVRDTWSIQASTASEWSWLIIFLLLKFSAWGLAALALASFTGAVRKAH